MTDEEKTELKAEKYVYEKLRLLDKNGEQFRYAKKVWLNGYHECQKEYEWHDLRKDPNDLPKKTDEYLVYRISGYGIKSTELIQYNSERHFWCVEHQNDVIKWCEIPTFDKE